jgi:hypothetical protein
MQSKAVSRFSTSRVVSSRHTMGLSIPSVTSLAFGGIEVFTLRGVLVIVVVSANGYWAKAYLYGGGSFLKAFSFVAFQRDLVIPLFGQPCKMFKKPGLVTEYAVGFCSNQKMGMRIRYKTELLIDICLPVLDQDHLSGPGKGLFTLYGRFDPLVRFFFK